MSFNRDILIAKLAQLRDAIDRIESKRPATLEILLEDRDVQDILAKNIERAVQVCVDIATHVATANGMMPKTAGDAFRMLSTAGHFDQALSKAMTNAVGFRNIAVHDYVRINWEVVMKISTNGLDDLRSFGDWATRLCDSAAPPPPRGRRT